MSRALPVLALLLAACGPDEALLQRVNQLEARQALMREETAALQARLDALDPERRAEDESEDE